MNFAKALGLAVLAAIASASATVSGESLTHPITSAPVLVHATFGTLSPIRTVVTVNSNRIDVLAGSEQDVPKVIEKLRQLCAGPHASMYPEICEHLDAVGSGVDPIIWWPPDHETQETPITMSRNPEDLVRSEASPLKTPGPVATRSSGSAEDTIRHVSATVQHIPTATFESSLATRQGGSDSKSQCTETANRERFPTAANQYPTTLETKVKELKAGITDLAQSSQKQDETPLDCPWKKGGGQNGDEPEQGCTVITIYHHAPAHTILGPAVGLSLGSTSGPTQSPVPSIILPAGPDLNQHPSPTQHSGCTETIRTLVRMSNLYTSTVFPGTVTATMLVQCTCPNLKIERIGAPGIVIRPRVTITESEPKTTTELQCSPTQF